jgi:hypothetical protein
MTAISTQPEIFRRAGSSLNWAIAVSLVFHAAVLFFPKLTPQAEDRRARRLEARLLPPPGPAPVAPSASIAPPVEATPAKPMTDRKARAPAIAEKRPAEAAPPAWSKAEKSEFDKFLKDLDAPPKPAPDLAQRALGMARAVGRQQAWKDDEADVLVERRPDGPPPDPVSIEMYLDGLVKKLNRSAAFVKNDPRARGVKPAAVLIRLSPSGSLQSFKVLYAGDQQEEIAYIQSVVERAVPFSAFPADLQKSANSLAMMICILPAHLSGGSIGFARTPDGRRC